MRIVPCFSIHFYLVEGQCQKPELNLLLPNPHSYMMCQLMRLKKKRSMQTTLIKMCHIYSHLFLNYPMHGSFYNSFYEMWTFSYK